MGNFWIPHFDSSSSSPCSTRPSSPAISRNNSNEGKHSSSLNEVSPSCQILPITPTSRIFSFAELRKATRDFSLDTLIGGGDFGPIFKCWIDEKTSAPTEAGSGMAIAVRKLNSEMVQAWKEWRSNANLLGRFSCPIEVGLLGYCWEDEELLLVYEFTPGETMLTAFIW